jgi:hypothetical protein
MTAKQKSQVLEQLECMESQLVALRLANINFGQKLNHDINQAFVFIHDARIILDPIEKIHRCE